MSLGGGDEGPLPPNLLVHAALRDVFEAAGALAAAVAIDRLTDEVRRWQGQLVREWITADEARTWSDVGEAFEITRQAAWERFHR